ncbi:hypothetical protein [Natrinema versiforme]|nr:hypothetical protein [Natrinema versiforme]
MDSETLTYIVSLVVIFLVICAAMGLAVAVGAVDAVTDYYGWVGPRF